MRALGTRQSSNDVLSKNRNTTNINPLVRLKSISPPPVGISLLRKKSVCPCDGGCARCLALKTKLKTGQPYDKYEEEEGPLQSKSLNKNSPIETVGLQDGIQSSQSGGQPLPGPVRGFFERRLGYDFSRVRIHTSSLAAQSARALNARAYTSGSHIVFNTGEYATAAAGGKKLLAHELAHVIQGHGNRDGIIRAQGQNDEDPGGSIVPILPPLVGTILSPLTCLLYTLTITEGMEWYKNKYVHDSWWREVMDAWFYETPPNPAVYSGLTDPRNYSIAKNAGFIELFLRWLDKEYGKLADGSQVDAKGFTWRYELPVSNTPGGAAAYDSATQLLGSYDASLDKIPGGYLVVIINESNWGSGTRIPKACREKIRKKYKVDIGSILHDHPRGMGPCYPSRGGDFYQIYAFTIAKSMVAKMRLLREQRGAGKPPQTPVANFINEFCNSL